MMKTKLKYEPWCNTYYRHEFCLEKAKELRSTGKFASVRVRNTIKDYDQNGNKTKFSKIYIAI